MLDSGADCHVLPLAYYSEDLGTVEFPALRMVIQDAQGTRIKDLRGKSEHHVRVSEDRWKSDQSPRFSSVWKVGWGLDPIDEWNAYLRKGSARVPVRFARNSTVTELKIYGAQVKAVEEVKVRKLTLMKQMQDDLEAMKYHEGWFFMSDGKPARFDWDRSTT